MRWRLLALFVAITTGLGIVQIVVPKVASSRAKVVTTLAPVICPNSVGGANVAIGGQGTRVSPIGKLPKGVKDVPFTTSRVVTATRISATAHLVENSLGGATQIDTSSGLAGLACPSLDDSYWFVGGSASLSSQDRLVLSNAGHGDALVTVLAWSDKGVVPAYPVVVPAQTSIRVGLDSIAPGVNAIVLHVIVRSGRVAASLYDQRVQGLTNLGADFVPPGIDPAKNFVVLGVPGTRQTSKASAKKGKVPPSKPISETRVIRLLSPTSGTSVRVDVIGAGDSFTPLGLDNIALAAGVVRDVPVTTSLPSSAYAFLVTADSPVVAGVFSSVIAGQGSDIAWSASTPSLSVGVASADFDGTTYLFYSNAAASIDISTMHSGEIPVKSRLVVPADVVLSWSPSKLGSGATVIRVTAIGGNVYAARLLRTTNGVTTSPLRLVAVTVRSTMPLADVGVGMPR